MSKFATPAQNESVFVHTTAIKGLAGLEAQNPLIQKGDLQGASGLSLDAIDEVMAGYKAQSSSLEPQGLREVSSQPPLATPMALTASSTLVIPSSNIVVTPIRDLVLTGDSNFSLGTAEDLDSLTGLRSRQGYVGGFDSVDYFKFDFSAIRDLTLSLTGTQGQSINGDLDLRLIQDKNNNGQIDSGEVLASSTRGNALNETLNKVLTGGTYFAEIKNYGGSGSQYEFRANAKLPEVNVNIDRVQALNSGIDFGSQADFYSKITIDGNTRTTGYIGNDNDITPNWSHSRTVDGTSRYVNVAIQMWDSDGGFNGADDRVDIDSGSGRDINVTYDLLTNRITGDLSGTGGNTMVSSGNSGDRARTTFKVTEGDWFDRNLGDNHLTNLARNAGFIDRSEMMTMLRETKDYGNVSSTELSDLRTIVERPMFEHVENLASKVVNGDAANSRSGIGNLYAGASAARMESLVGKWFMGNDRPDAVSFNRSQRFSYREMSGSLFQDGISTDDVDQNGVGDCYFMTSLSAAAQDKAHIIRNMFIDNGDDTFTVKFFKPDGSRDYVTVDRFLPTNSWGRAVFAGWGGGTNTSDNNELWAALAEKAYAQVNESGWIGQDNSNSYNGTTVIAGGVTSNNAGINGGWMRNSMRHITGYSTTSEDANDMTRTELVNLVRSNKMLTVGFVNGTSNGVVNNHAYTITAYDSTTGLFSLDNPWGSSDATVTFAQLQSMQGRIEYTNV